MGIAERLEKARAELLGTEAPAASVIITTEPSAPPKVLSGPAPEVLTPKTGPVEYLVGLRREKNGYALVIASIQDGKLLTHDVDPVVEPLQYATRQLLNAARSMLGNIP